MSRESRSGNHVRNTQLFYQKRSFPTRLGQIIFPYCIQGTCDIVAEFCFTSFRLYMDNYLNGCSCFVCGAIKYHKFQEMHETKF